MKDEYIDITYSISNNMPKWPGSKGIDFEFYVKMPEANNNTSSFRIDTHLGTHIDAPLHFVEHGKSVDTVALEKLIGKAYVVEMYGIKSISSKDLEYANIPLECKKLLLKTDNQTYWQSGESAFQEDFTSIDASGAQWVVDRGIELIGIDYLSIQRYHDSADTHQILLNNEVVILETINLNEVFEGWYELFCLPLKIVGLEGSPVRAILKKLYL